MDLTILISLIFSDSVAFSQMVSPYAIKKELSDVVCCCYFFFLGGGMGNELFVLFSKVF